jgi:hypothetical protein
MSTYSAQPKQYNFPFCSPITARLFAITGEAETAMFFGVSQGKTPKNIVDTKNGALKSRRHLMTPSASGIKHNARA